MLRNMKLGTKLLAVILPPLIVLVVVAGIGARDRLAESADARAADQYIELAAASSATVSTMQWERNLSLYVLYDGEDADDQLQERRERTDAEWDRLEAIAAEVADSGNPGLVADIDRALAHRSRIQSYRGSLDSGTTDPWIVRAGFDTAIGDQLTLITEVSNNVPVVEVSSDLASFAALMQAKEAAAQTGATVTMAITAGEFDEGGRMWRTMRDSEAQLERYSQLFYDISPPELQSQLRPLVDVPDASERMRLEVVSAIAGTIDWIDTGRALEDPVELDFSASRWIDLSENRVQEVGSVGDGILGGVRSFVSDVRSEAERAVLIFTVITAAAVILSAIGALVVARKISRPVQELTEAADRLSTEKLPILVERLRNPKEGSGGVVLEPIGMDRKDEIGRLADAFDTIQRVTVEVAEEQSNLLRKGIGDIFVNLARRNQTLLDRQIEFIDQLESAEEDPDLLEDLFKLDHLATRMRRNAESLLVLAGADTGHRRSKPVPLADVVRVAIGEVEDFARLELLALDDAMVSGTAAMDVAHLLSELMENATSFSPPETHVEIQGHLREGGGYIVTITDHGIGMSDEQLAEANELLAHPPLVGLSLSRSLGFTVVGRLASRFEIEVQLAASPNGGVTAVVTLSDNVLHSTVAETDNAPAETASGLPTRRRAAATAPEPVVEVAAADEDPVLDLEPDLPAPATPAPDWVAPGPASSTLASAVPEGEAFDAGLAALIGEDASGGDQSIERAAEPSAPSLFSEPVAPADDAAIADPDSGGTTSSGLVRRVPRAQAPVSEHVERPGASTTSVAASQRSPEEVRAMLSRYRSGLQRASHDDAPGSSGGSTDQEGTDR